jgi:Amt family ammonium transporter
VGGFIGTVLVAVFASPIFGGLGYAEGMTMGSQLTTQLLASVYTILLSGVVSVILLKVIDATIGLRVDGDEENQGLDLSEHGESGYNS